MKKFKFAAIITALIVAVSVMPCAAAPDYVIDSTGSFSASDIAVLQAQCEEIADTYSCDVVLLLVDGLGGKTAMQYADDYFDYNGYGQGRENGGILFLLSLEERDWWMSTSGNAINIFDDSYLNRMFDSIRSDLASDRYFDAFSEFTVLCVKRLESWTAGEYVPGDIKDNPYPDDDYYDDYGKTAGKDVPQILFIGAVSGVVAAVILCVVFVKQMKSVAPGKRAAQYVEDGSMKITGRSDIFLYSHTSRVKRPDPPSNSGGGGGSSIHIGGSGHSHGGTGGKF